uniref:amino acid adenylation domain-containing protein n=1 Tax=Aquimarina algiphila TaxID=2047982 RepID=UPI002492DC80
SNTQVYIFDSNLNIVPIGVVGELCISGAGLARGYYNSPELTAEKFIDHPFEEGLKLYKTGDFARWLPSGDLQFIGRKDHQVKIRGYRIELGEIESALARIESIEQSVVLAREDGNGLKQLVAYIVSKGEVNHVITEQKLKEHLPEYMIPKIYVSIDQIPLTKNGKIDHKALPNFDQSAYNKKEYVAPSSDTEIKLTEIWEQVLKIEKIGVRDDFFDLGGNSLIAVRLTGRYNKIFNKKITIKEIFANPVLEDHVDLIKTSSDETYMEIKKVENSESYPLSNAQYRLWLVSQVEEGSIAYNMPNTIILNGEYNVNYFQKAIYHVIDRHEILRTIFKTNESGEVRQFVQSAEDFDLVIDIKDYREKNDPKLACESYVLSDSTRPFDLEKGPLFRASLLQLSDNQYVFYYNMHHIIGDGWSKSILSNDVMKYYEAYVTGTISDIPTLRIQYKDYTAWQLEQFKDPKFQYSKNYWSSQLSGELPILNLPSQKKRPRIKTYQGHKIGTRISSDLTEQLQSFAAERRGGFFSAISAVCNVLIYRYTGETDIIFGNPVAGRDHPDLEDQIGFYINILALRNKISPNHSFIDFFDQVNETILKAYEHQLYPFDRLIEDLKLQRDTSRNALFDLWINYHETPETGISFENDNEVRDLGNGTVKFDIEFDFIKVKDGVDFVISYNKDIYEQEMIERFILHFKILLKQLLDHPDQSISNVEFLIEDEKKKLLYDFNNFKEDYPKNQTVVDQFRKRAKKTPDAIALIFEGSELTYQDLDDKSDQLAHYLLSQGVQKESLIPICIDRSLEMIIGILGILKAGGAYVPVDSGYPLQRIKFIIEDIDAKMILTQTTLSKIFEDNQSSIQIINLDQLPETNNKLIKNVLNKIITPSQLAYIIYTSGTTGRPKGVMITHSSLLDYATTFNNYFGVSQSDRVLQQASISFDISVEEIFPILIKGGSLYISKEINDFEKLIKICEKEEITILSTHPYLIQFMNENFHEEELPLRVLISGGDTLKKEFVSNIANRYNIFNTYGPTESTVCASYAKIGINDLVISIGKPIANKQVYILSDEESLQPMGIAGELCIGGAGLAKGYLNLPGLTSKKFIPHPFKDGEKIYKTGDLARWLPDGNIEFLGRKDDQVKIMGYRIELGEIESVLDQQEDIQQSYVMVSEDNDSKYLVAYIVCDGESDVSIIQQNLRGIIPEYMVPKVFITLDEMPLTPNGKVDRKSLPNPVIGGNQEYVGPSSVTEIQLTRIWQEALDIDKISIHDNFFDLGGNSLSAIKIILQMRKELDIEVDIKSLFDTNTIADLALQIDFSINQEEIRSESKIVKQIM